jgi:(p)ppGpp synthase/HD superfamily hydrolase
MDDSKDMLTERFKAALDYAFELHAHQKRKSSQIPYISHLLGVTSLVLEDGGGEDEAIAALLHDAVEDQGGIPTLEEIRLRFGERVAYLVDGLTDAYGNPKPPWRQRKERYLKHLAGAEPAVRRVSLADKLHNARSILANLQTLGPVTWKRFHGGQDGTIWYYRSLLDIFQAGEPSFMVTELARVVRDIECLAN